MKSTDQLMDELMKAHNIGEYLKANSKYMISDELPTYLLNILKKKSLVKSAVIKRSELSEVMGYQIFSGTRNPSRDSLISICVAMELSIDETQELLRVAQFALLYPRVKRDCIIINGIAAKKAVADINEDLYDNAEPTLNQ
ncbi:MAG: helix-turn-helix transcriptional regulator [Clostridia bacterium]|nr:helix-turn-helix transcriptional regulator [Clostridia bacterium]